MMLSTNLRQPELFSLGRFRVISVIAQSDRATVMLVQDEKSDRAVVLKQFDASTSQFFMHETSVALGLNHPGLLACEGSFYSADGKGCLVFEYMAGGTLRKHLDSLGRLTVNEAAECLGELLQSLVYLHNKGWIHSDLKPENIFLRYKGAGLKSKWDHKLRYVVGDLGSSCLQGFPDNAMTGQGTPAYRAPETFFRQQEPQSDLYSLGIIAYELVTGVLPFSGSVREIQKAHAQSAVSLEKIYDPVWREFVGALLEVDLSDRLESAHDALSMLYETGLLSGFSGKSESYDRQYGKEHGQVITVVDDRQKEYQTRQLQTWQGVLLRPPRALHLVSFEGQQWLAVADKRRARIITLNHKTDADQTVATLISKGGYRIMNDGSIGYRSAGFLNAYQPRQKIRKCLSPLPVRLNSLRYDDSRMLWSDIQGYHLVDFDDGNRRDFPPAASPGSASRPAIALLQQGFFANQGTLNRDVVFYHATLDEIYRFKLPDPVLVLAGAEHCGYAITLMTAGKNQYRLWQIYPDRIPELMELPAFIVNWSFSANHLDVLLEDGDIWRFGSQSPFRLCQLDDLEVEAFSITPQADFIAFMLNEKDRFIVHVNALRPEENAA